MIVVFVIVLVVFGPQKLPELARGLGKLMAEFRKASTDFKSAFEEEMRDLERQAREVERKKAELLASSRAALAQPATLATPSGSETQSPAPELAPSNEDTRASEGGMITPSPVPESMPRSMEPSESQSAPDSQLASTGPAQPKPDDLAPADPVTAPNDHQQPA